MRRAAIARLGCAGMSLLVLTLAGCPKPVSPPRGEAAATPPAPSENPPPPQPPVATPAPTPPGETPPTPPPPPKPRPAKIKIVVRSTPPKAFVSWGKKVLGQTPVTLERPRDSGPVDLIVRAEGCFPVHTRAYTFRNESMTVKLTKLADRMSLFGAKKEPEGPTVGPGIEPPEGTTPPTETPPPSLSPLEPPAN